MVAVAKKLKYRSVHPPESIHKPTSSVFIDDGKSLVKVKDILRYGSVRLLLPEFNN